MIRVAGVHDQVDAGLTEPRRRRPHADARCSTTIRERVARARRAPHALHRATSCCPRWPSTASGSSRCDERRRRASATRSRERFRRQIFPVLTPLAVGLGRPFPYISNLSLSLAVLLRDPQTAAAHVRAREGAEGDARPLRRGRRRGRPFVPLEEVIADEPRRAVPGHGDPRATAYFRVTRDADFEISDEADDLLEAVEDRAAPPALRRGRAARGRGRDAATSCASSIVDALERRGAPGLRGRRACSTPATSCRSSTLPGLRRAARPAVDAGDPAAPAGRRRRRRRPRRDARGRHPRPPPVRLVHHVGRALRRAGGRRPRRARDQADDLPHERRHAARPGARPGDRARQAGGLPRGAQGALRRAGEHHVGQARSSSRACTSSTATRR